MRFKALLLSRVAGGLLALVLSLAADAAPILPGAVLPALALEDQHGRTVSTSANTRLVLFAADKAASDLINEVLAARPAARLWTVRILLGVIVLEAANLLGHYLPLIRPS